MTKQGPVWVKVDTCGECPRFEGSEWIRCTDREYAHMDGPPPPTCPLRAQEPEEITKLKAEVERYKAMERKRWESARGVLGVEPNKDNT